MQKTSFEDHSWLDKPVSSIISLKLETLLFVLIILLTIFSRLYELGERVMSHDEINHVYFAWQFFQNAEYAHHPLSHGPLQFHLLSFFYFLFGDNDISARLHAAVSSIGTVIFLWKFRRYLGRSGTLVASVLFLISPFMLFYGRYARNEALTTFFVVVSVWAVLRYLDTGQNRYMYILAGASALHFTTKETAFIFTAQLLFFLGILFIYRISHKTWKIPKTHALFFTLLIITFILIAVAGGLYLLDTPVTIEEETTSIPISVWVCVIAASVVFISAFITLIIGYGWDKLREERTFGLLLLQFTLIFPQLSAFPMFWAGWPIFDYHSTESILRIVVILIPMIAISIAGGVLWKPREWLISAGIFYGIFIFFYSTVFTNAAGIYTGLVGSLGYWLEQQGVERGSQPSYYYVLVQIPMYEYLSAIGTLLAAGFGLKWLIRKPYGEVKTKDLIIESDLEEELPEEAGKIHMVSFGFFAVITGILAYMVAGEKMPWLTVHMIWPMLLVTGWAIGKLIDSINWHTFKEKFVWLILTLFIILVVSTTGVVSALIDSTKPFQGTDLKELRVTSNFIIAAIVVILCIGGVIYQIRARNFRVLIKTGALIIFTLLGVLTVRSTILASYINYDYGTEYLVYAHGGHGPKEIFNQIQEISYRITGGNEIKIAYDNHSAYPFWWYLRNYPNQLQYGESPTRDVRDYPIILVGDSNYGKITPLVGEAYIMTEYIRMVWPNQDYFNLDHLITYLRNPETRGEMLNAILKIWLNHDYQSYGEVTGQDMSVQNWNPSNKMRMYVRKDIASQIWEYGSSIDTIGVIEDPFKDKEINIQPALTIDYINLNQPRGITTSKEGTVYIADTGNDRVLHLRTDGEILQEWGSGGVFADNHIMPEGYFNQPWGLTIDEDGFVYVADTWNHRIQKFTSSGKFITTWGQFNNQPTDNLGMWGPRDISVDQDNYLLVSDTGNKRILIFNSEGIYLKQIGEVGFLLGQFDEPVGLAISPVTGDLYVADTWNQRIQRFERTDVGEYTIAMSWDIDGWYGQSLDNKPYIAIDQYDRVFVADPEGARILVFSNDGTVIGYIGSFENFFDNFGLVSGLALDNEGGLWVADGRKNRIQYFILPTP